MKPVRLASIMLSALAVVAVSLPLTASAATSRTAVTDRTPAPRPTVAVYNCGSRPEVRPGTFDILCNGSEVLSHLQWTSWTLPMASGTGVDNVDSCKPSCAHGRWQREDVDVVLWRSVAVPHHAGRFAYTRMTLLYLQPRRGQAQTWTSSPPGAF